MAIKLYSETCGKAGGRKNHPEISLMDTIILTQARKKELKIITGDKHLQDRKETAKILIQLKYRSLKISILK